jgi:lipoprotein-releasing system ATP-binding protein
MRNTFLGFIFQFHHLLPEFTALENVMLPCLIAGNSEQKAKEEAKALLSHLGLSERMQHYPSDMSGGEQQRVSVCRALVNRPAVILADEPTGNLDLQNATEMLDLLAKVQQDFGMSMLIATHDHAVKSYCERVLTLNMEGLKQEE